MKYLRAYKIFESFGVYKALQGYLHCALWTGEFDNDDFDDISEISINNARNDVDNFLDELEKKGLLRELIKKIDLNSIGHDFWLNRNGHGSGFWDRGLGELGDKVSDICSKFSQKYIYKGDDKKIYID